MHNSMPELEDVAKEIAKHLNLKFLSYEGKGSFKETYKVQDQSNRTYALKVFNPGKSSIERTEREISAMKKCDFKYIGKLYAHDYFEMPDTTKYLYFLEQFFDGGNLSKYLEPGNSKPNIKEIAVPLIECLEYLKEQNLVHRDIKPDNIMFKNGESYPYLVDFGIVRDLSSVSLTPTWIPRGPGTPYYSSPEQLLNDKHLIDWKTDQYSIGLIFGIYLTGQHPFFENGMNDGDIIAKIENRENCTSEFLNLLDASGYIGIEKMIDPWPVQRFLKTDDILKFFT